MFIIASLIVVLLYNGMDRQESGSRNLTGKNQVEAANLFLYFLVPLFIFNYLGTIYHSEAGLIMSIVILCLVFLVLWVVCMAWWAGYKIFPERCSCKKEGSRNEPDIAGSHDERSEKVTVVFYFLGLASLIVFVVLLAAKNIDFPATFLFACISETLLVIVAKIIARLVTWWKSDKSCSISTTKRKVLRRLRFLSRSFYVLGVGSIWVAALVFFLGKETRDKVKSPEQTRDLNQECSWLDFFDSHDIWHILSSFALLMSALLAIHVSYDPNTCENGKTEAKGNTGSNIGEEGGTRETEAKGEMDSSMQLVKV